MVKTPGKRTGYQRLGMIASFTGRLFQTGQSARFTAAPDWAFIRTMRHQTARPLISSHEGARYPTAKQTQECVAQHAAQRTVYPLPAYSPDDKPIAHLGRTVKRGRPHTRYFPTFAALCQAVDEGVAQFQAHPAEVMRLRGRYREAMAACPQAASSRSFPETL